MPSKDFNQVLLEASQNYATKIVESGDYTYVAIAPTGTSQEEAGWQVKRIDASTPGTTVITWADGDDLFDNEATDLPSLTYL